MRTDMAACFDFGRLSRPNKQKNKTKVGSCRPSDDVQHVSNSWRDILSLWLREFGCARRFRTGPERERARHNRSGQDMEWVGWLFPSASPVRTWENPAVSFHAPFFLPFIVCPDVFFWVCGGCRPACTARFPSISKFNMSSYSMGGMLVRDKVVFLSLKSSVFIS